MLAAQYERWTLPIAVLLAVPFAMLVLVGLPAKDAILIFEFCVALRARLRAHASSTLASVGAGG